MNQNTGTSVADKRALLARLIEQKAAGGTKARRGSEVAHGLIEAQAAKTPEAVAVACGDARLTYRELDVGANRLAHRLRSLGVGPEVLVGLYLGRSPAMLVALLAVLKAGGAYVPLDPSFPEGRLALMLDDARVSVLVTEQALRETVPASGGLLAAPMPVHSLLLAPGERADVLLDLRGDAGQTLKFISAAFSVMGAGMSAMGMMASAPPQGTAFDLLSLAVSNAQATNAGSIPAAFAPITRYDLAAAAVNRTFELTEMTGMSSALHRINNLVYDGARIDFVARRGDLERWQFINRGMEPHPMHVHGTQFQVVSRDGIETRRLPTDLGWKDTVLVRAFESVEIALRFGIAGNYVLHCHNLEHEDDGMMLNFNVIN